MISLYIAQTEKEALNAQQKVIEETLHKKIELLQNRLELREQLRAQAAQIIEENAKLKVTIQEKTEQLESASGFQGRLKPMLERLWNHK